MHEFYKRPRRRWLHNTWKPALGVVVAIGLAVAVWVLAPNRIKYEGFELHGGPLVTNVAVNPTVVMLTSHRMTRRVTTGRSATRSNNFSDLNWDLFAFNAGDLSQKWTTRLSSIRRGELQLERGILGVSQNTIWVLADGLFGISLSDGEVIGDAESIEALNPQMKGLMPTSRKQIYFDNGLMLVTADGRTWRIDGESLRARLDTSTIPVKTSALGNPVSRGTDSLNVLPLSLSSQYQWFKTRDFVVNDTWYGMMHPSEVERQRTDPHTQDFNSAIRFRLWSSPLRDTVNRFRDRVKRPLDFAPLGSSPEFLRGGLLSIPNENGRLGVVGIAKPTRFIVVHQDRIDSAAVQTLTCLSLEGKVCWDAPLEMYIATGFAMLTRVKPEDWALIVFGVGKPRPGDKMVDGEGDDMPMLARVNIADGKVTRFRFAEIDFAALDEAVTPYRRRFQ